MLQLAVKAGSVDETDAQQGLAHFLEHMGFNGSKHFKPGELIADVRVDRRAAGAARQRPDRLRRHDLHVPAAHRQAGIVEKGMQALADFAGGMTLDPKEIDKERGVVIEEWRGGLGAGSRLRDQQIPVLFHKSKYAERLPIGKPEILKTFPPAELRAFYTKWYRPDRMAVVAVGDMESAALEALIKKEFGALAKPATPAPARELSDAAASRKCWSRWRPMPKRRSRRCRSSASGRSEPQDKVADYRRSLVNSLAYEMLNERFDEISRKADAPFLGAGAYGGALTPTVDTFTLGASVQDGKIERGLVGARDRSEPRRALRLRRRRARSRAQMDARELRPRLRRARQDRERLVRAGVRQQLPAGRAQPGHRVRAASWCRRWCRRSPPPTWRRRPRRCSPTPAA